MLSPNTPGLRPYFGQGQPKKAVQDATRVERGYGLPGAKEWLSSVVDVGPILDLVPRVALVRQRVVGHVHWRWQGHVLQSKVFVPL